MNRLQISTATPNRPYAVDVINPADSGPARVTIYSGVVTLVGNPGFRGIIRGTDVGARFNPGSRSPRNPKGQDRGCR